MKGIPSGQSGKGSEYFIARFAILRYTKYSFPFPSYLPPFFLCPTLFYFFFLFLYALCEERRQPPKKQSARERKKGGKISVGRGIGSRYLFPLAVFLSLALWAAQSAVKKRKAAVEKDGGTYPAGRKIAARKGMERGSLRASFIQHLFALFLHSFSARYLFLF